MPESGSKRSKFLNAQEELKGINWLKRVEEATIASEGLGSTMGALWWQYWRFLRYKLV